MTALLRRNSYDQQLVTGTFLVTFDDEAKVNNTIYRNLKSYVKKYPAPAASTVINIMGHQELLSLPYLQKLNMENLRYIAHWARKLIFWPTICNFFPGAVRRMQIELFNELKVKFIGYLYGIDNPSQNRKIVRTFRVFIFIKNN